MKVIKIATVTLLGFCLDFCFCQYFTTSFEIEKLLETESKIFDGLNSYCKRQKERGFHFDEEVLSFVDKAGQRNREVNRNHDYDNPLTNYHLIKRAVQDWTKVKETLTCDKETSHSECPIMSGADVINNVLKEDGSKWPNELDLRLAVEAILNVQNVYNISIHQLRQGTIGMAVVQPLTADDIFFIGSAAKDYGMTYEAITWFEYLAQHLDEFVTRNFSASTLHRRLSSSYFEYGIHKKAVSILEEFSVKGGDQCDNYTTDPSDKGVSRDLDFLRSRRTTGGDEEPGKVLRFKERSNKVEERLKYENICRNAVERSAPLNTSLRCYFRRLYRTYGVYKVEVLARRPKIELVYEVIGSSDAYTLQTYGEKTFGKSQHVLPVKERMSSEQSLVSSRLCEGRAYPVLKNLTKLLTKITNFQMYFKYGRSSSECYKVVNEGLGSVQNFVMSAWPKDKLALPLSGNRVATIMVQVTKYYPKLKAFCWLSDVQFGGQIIFPKINVAVPVVKGSAVVWWNLKQNGDPDPRALHISCPTVVGSNWVAVKHVLYDNQIFQQPCDLTR